ncbi:MAG: hypothetical protein MZV64_63010 [Ignavibacteriales bacterium]|nr:hypothetical protein [Ignavibacteriales bacterium]
MNGPEASGVGPHAREDEQAAGHDDPAGLPQRFGRIEDVGQDQAHQDLVIPARLDRQVEGALERRRA